jgi:hypothetical protein
VLPSQYLDSISDAALSAQREGRQLSGSGSGGTSVQFVVFQNWDPSEVLELIDRLRPACAEPTLESALATLNAQAVTSYRPDFSQDYIR